MIDVPGALMMLGIIWDVVGMAVVAIIVCIIWEALML